ASTPSVRTCDTACARSARPPPRMSSQAPSARPRELATSGQAEARHASWSDQVRRNCDVLSTAPATSTVRDRKDVPFPHKSPGQTTFGPRRRRSANEEAHELRTRGIAELRRYARRGEVEPVDARDEVAVGRLESCERIQPDLERLRQVGGRGRPEGRRRPRRT